MSGFGHTQTQQRTVGGAQHRGDLVALLSMLPMHTPSCENVGTPRGSIFQGTPIVRPLGPRGLSEFCGRGFP